MSSAPFIDYKVNPPASDAALNALFAESWPDHAATDFQTVLCTSMAYLCAYDGAQLVGYISVAWDGKTHAFLLNTTVRPSHRHRGIGRQLVRHAIDEARRRGVTWVHVDFEPHLRGFYAQCGFRHSEAGVVNLAATTSTL